MPFLILCDGHEEDDHGEDDMEEGMGDKVKADEHHIRKKRYVEISVDRNSFPNHILPSFASEKIETKPHVPQLIFLVIAFSDSIANSQ